MSINSGNVEKQQQLQHQPGDDINYQIDSRPICEGMPFLLSDAAHPRKVLKHGSHFLILDQSGSIPACNSLGYGYYRYDTRHISQWDFILNDSPFSLLSSSVHKGHYGSFLYTNTRTGDIQQQKLTLERNVVLDDLLWEKLVLENYETSALDVELKMQFQSDFADMFEVRGLNRPHRGECMVPEAGPDGRSLFLAYRGLDDALLETIVEFSVMSPVSIKDGVVTFQIHLPVRTPVALELCVLTRQNKQLIGSSGARIGYDNAQASAEKHYQDWRNASANIETEHAVVNLTLDRCYRDFYILRQPTPRGLGLAAGIPWYGAIFGRDSAIAGLQCLPFMPSIARETIEVLAAYQGREYNELREEEPGRIMHELRLGELARTGQIPHNPYYGTIDATQLWLILLSEYVSWTGDTDVVKRLWPAVLLALEWFQVRLEKGNGYLTYQQISDQGLVNEGWKDSNDSIVNSDGTLCIQPIAVCEAQAYLYAAWLGVAHVAVLIGQSKLSDTLVEQAESFKKRFQKDFWIEDQNYLALALDGNGKRAEVVSSNPGHCLWSGILDDDKANAVADRLMAGDMHSGWGIRTLSSKVVAYNPISYHNGSVWPHDNTMIGEGMRRLGRIADMHEIMRGMIEVSSSQPDYRLPELFCGFTRRAESNKPIEYPVSCSPQAWASGSIFQMLKAAINFQPDAPNKRIRIVEPALPEWLGQVTVKGVKVGDATLDLAFNNRDGATFCQILGRAGQIRTLIES